MSIIDEILERHENLQHLAQPQDMIAWKAVTDTLRADNYVVITRSLYEHLCERPTWQLRRTLMMTRQDLKRLGHKVRGTYRGPLDWELCTGLYDDLQQCKGQDGTHVFPAGTLFIVRQDPGFNIVTVER